MISNLGSAARSLNNELASHSKMVVGAEIMHPKGYMVKVISGEFLDSIYGRVSNWWHWRRINEDGSLGEEEHGYGW